MKLLRWLPRRSINRRLDEEIVDAERRRELDEMARETIVELDIERKLAGFVEDDRDFWDEE
jgi:hypothetical protein